MVALGTNWEWEIPVGMGNLPRRLRQEFHNEVVVWIHGPGYSHYRRFQAQQGDAVQLRIEPFRSIPNAIGDERRTSPVSVQDYPSDVPVLTRSSAFDYGMGWSRTGTPIDPEVGSCDSISTDSYDVWLEGVLRDLEIN